MDIGQNLYPFIFTRKRKKKLLNVLLCYHYCNQAEVNAIVGQEIDFELWDYDPGFPGVQNDDFLGRW